MIPNFFKLVHTVGVSRNDGHNTAFILKLSAQMYQYQPEGHGFYIHYSDAVKLI